MPIPLGSKARPRRRPSAPLRGFLAAEVRRDGREAEATRIVRSRAARPFDLARECPLRVAVIQIDAAECLLHVDSHHIAADGWSRDVMFRDLDAVYSAMSRGAEPVLPTLPI